MQLQATAGTAPYTWQETTGRIPAGITLTKEGKLFGNATSAGGTYNLVFKVTDTNGAIRKKALELNTTGNNLNEKDYGWDNRYYFNTLATPNFIDGTVVTALNGGSANVTVNGITFQGTNLGGGYKSAYTGGISGTGNAGYNNLLSTMSEATSNEAEIALTGLTAGTTYSLQVFYNNKNDADGFAAQMHLDIDGDGPGDVVLKASHTEQANTDYGSYVVANFIAYAPEMNLSLKARSDSYSIKGKAAFTALLVTQPATVARHTGDTKHAEITWEAPTAVTGLDDLMVVEGITIKALNGGNSSIDFTADGGPVFEPANIGTVSNIANDTTDSYADNNFAQLMSEQTRTRYYHPLVLENLEVGKTYKVQIFNTAKAFETYQQDYNGTDPTKRHYLGSDTSFGLQKHGDVNIHEFGGVMSSIGTFTATSTEQLIEMNVNEHNSIKDISFSAIYLVDISSSDLPVADGLQVTVSQQYSPVDITLSGIDPAGAALSYTIDSLPEYGELTGTAPNLTYTLYNLVASDSFTYIVTSANGSSYPATVSISYDDGSPQPLAHWKFDDGSGSVIADSSGNGYDATVSNATWSSDGRLAGALGMEATGHDVTFPVAPFSLIEDDVTLSFWANGGVSQPRAGSILTGGGINIHLPWSNGSIFWDAGSIAGGTDRISKSATEDQYKGSWSYWVFTKNVMTGEMKIYYNGELWHSGSGNTLPLDFSANVNIYNYDGAIDDFRLYDSELTAAEVADIYAEADQNYAGWLESNALGEDLNYDADSDGDGLLDLMEYIVMQDPSSQSDDGPVFSVLPAGGASIDFDYNLETNDEFDLILQYTSSLNSSDWTDVPITGIPHESVSFSPALNGVIPTNVNLDSDLVEDKRLFWRLKATEK